MLDKTVQTTEVGTFVWSILNLEHLISISNVGTLILRINAWCPWFILWRLEINSSSLDSQPEACSGRGAVGAQIIKFYGFQGNVIYTGCICCMKRAGSTLHCVARLDSMTGCIYSTCCTNTDHATSRLVWAGFWAPIAEKVAPHCDLKVSSFLVLKCTCKGLYRKA